MAAILAESQLKEDRKGRSSEWTNPYRRPVDWVGQRCPSTHLGNDKRVDDRNPRHQKDRHEMLGWWRYERVDIQHRIMIFKRARRPFGRIYMMVL